MVPIEQPAPRPGVRGREDFPGLHRPEPGLLSVEAGGGAGNFERKAKSCIVWLGFMDPHLHLLARDSPAISRVSIMCVLQVVTSCRMHLWGADMKRAYLQGDTTDPG